MKFEKNSNETDATFIRERLIQYNLSLLPEEVKSQPKETVNFVVKNENDEIIGGITGTMYWHHMHIDFLWVEESLRSNGYGRQLLEKMINYSKEKKCRFIFLDTFSFQAPEFYKKHGFKVFGVLEDHPMEGTHKFYLEKRL